MKATWRQLLLLVVLAAVFGAGFGYLGGNFKTAPVPGLAQAESSQPLYRIAGSL